MRCRACGARYPLQDYSKFLTDEMERKLGMCRVDRL
ncbi:MAG: hypothetical protein AB7W37_03240 [Syntrophobacteraceae bacterium]